MKKSSATQILKDAMRSVAHKQYVDALRDGRVQRSTSIPSAKKYKGNEKHRGQDD